MTSQTYRHLSLRKEDDLLWLTLDRADSSVNTLSVEVMEELDSVFDDLSKRSARGLVILSSKAKGFIAGADVHAFSDLEDKDSALALVRRGQAVMDKLEKLPMATLALIHGHCLGGGLELALACTYRIARSDPDTTLGLPEIKLGIHPGFGGTARLIRTIGPLPAMRLMLAGKTVSSKKAASLGLVDHAVPERLWRESARKLLADPPRPQKPGLLKIWPGLPGIRPLVARFLRRKTAEHARPDHYPAPFALIDVWEAHGNDKQAMLEAEASSVADLITSEVARNLVRLFTLRTRLKSLAKTGAEPMTHVHVIGGGTMGGAIAAWCALSGFKVTAQVRRTEQLGKVIKRGHGLFAKELYRSRDVEAAMDRLIPDGDGSGLAKADLVIEAISEDMQAKKKLYDSLEPVMRQDAVLASNTSGLSLSELAMDLRHPERFVGLHFFNPIPKMKLVEVAGCPATSRGVLDAALSFVGSLDKLPLPVADEPGYLVNRVLLPYLLEAVQLVEEGESPQAVDQPARDFGMPMGPLELADQVGLDVCQSVGKTFADAFGLKLPTRLEQMVKDGKLGKKSGEGFYRYEKGSRKEVASKHPTGNGLAADVVQDRLILRLVNECLSCLHERVVEDADLLDAGLVFGTGFAPFRGGPMAYLGSRGIEPVLERLGELEKRYGERFAPGPGWKEASQFLETVSAAKE